MLTYKIANKSMLDQANLIGFLAIASIPWVIFSCYLSMRSGLAFAAIWLLYLWHSKRWLTRQRTNRWMYGYWIVTAVLFAIGFIASYLLLAKPVEVFAINLDKKVDWQLIRTLLWTGLTAFAFLIAARLVLTVIVYMENHRWKSKT